MDKDILFMTMALLDFTMSTALISKWLRQVKPYLVCEQPERKVFEKTVRTIQEKHRERVRRETGETIEVDASSAGRLLPHEFLFLLCNAKPRLETMEQIRHPVINPRTVESRCICEEYELQDPAHRMNRNRIFNLDTIKNFNPRDNIYELLDRADNAENARIRITGMEGTIRSKNLEQEVQNQIRKDKLQTQKFEFSEAAKKKKKEGNLGPGSSTNSQQPCGVAPGGGPQNIKVETTFNKRKQSTSSNMDISSSRWDSQRDQQLRNNEDIGTLGIILENAKAVRRDPYLYQACNCVLCHAMRLAKPLPYTEPRVLDADGMARFKALMLEQGYFARIKEVLNGIAPEVELTRCGGAVSSDYIHELEQGNCFNETRNQLRHDLDYRQYLEENKARMSSVVNKGDTFDEGAPGAGLARKTKKLHHQYESLDKIRTGKRKIRAHQDKAIFTAYEAFKGEKAAGIFYHRNVESNPTVWRAVQKNKKKKRDREEDSYGAADQAPKEATLGASKTMDRPGTKEGSAGPSAPARGGNVRRHAGAAAKGFARSLGAAALGKKVGAAVEDAHVPDGGRRVSPENRRTAKELAAEVALKPPASTASVGIPRYYGTMVAVVRRELLDARAWHEGRLAEEAREAAEAARLAEAALARAQVAGSATIEEEGAPVSSARRERWNERTPDRNFAAVPASPALNAVRN